MSVQAEGVDDLLIVAALTEVFFRSGHHVFDDFLKIVGRFERKMEERFSALESLLKQLTDEFVGFDFANVLSEELHDGILGILQPLDTGALVTASVPRHNSKMALATVATHPGFAGVPTPPLDSKWIIDLNFTGVFRLKPD